MDTIKLSIVTPTGSIFNGDVKTVTLPGKRGRVWCFTWTLIISINS